MTEAEHAVLSERYRQVRGHEPRPAELRAAKREWASVLELINVLCRRTKAPRIPVVCKDGHVITLLAREGTTEFCTVTVDAEDKWTREWGAKQPARRMYRDVHVSRIVEWVWIHGGVDLPASREAEQ